MSTNTLSTTDTRTHTARVYTPRADLYAGPDALLLQVDLPGVASDGLAIEVHNGQLQLDGRRSDSVRYRRVLKLPEGIDPDGITAELKHGVLSLTLPKAATHRPRRIAVNGG